MGGLSVPPGANYFGPIEFFRDAFVGSHNNDLQDPKFAIKIENEATQRRLTLVCID